jgi:hypothetical protein
MKPINTLCVQNAEFLDVTACGTRIEHCASEHLTLQSRGI